MRKKKQTNKTKTLVHWCPVASLIFLVECKVLEGRTVSAYSVLNLQCLVDSQEPQVE